MLKNLRSFAERHVLTVYSLIALSLVLVGTPIAVLAGLTAG